MTIDQAEHPVRCVDIGYGGIRVVAPAAVRPAPGKRAVVRFERGGQPYQDELSVVHSEPATDGTVVRLSL